MIVSTTDPLLIKKQILTLLCHLGYKIVFDNVDVTVKARYIRTDGTNNQDLHLCHCICVLNRINLSNLSINLPDSCLDSPDRIATQILPSSDDDKLLLSNFEMLVSRVLATHIPFMHLMFSDVIVWHLKHQYYDEMCWKSEVVRTCINK